MKEIDEERYPGYEDVLAYVFGSEVNFGQYVKQYTHRGRPVLDLDDESATLPPGSKFAGAHRRVVQGKIDDPLFHTAYVEGVIGRYRKLLRCLNKKWCWRSVNAGRLQDALHIATFAFNYMLKREIKIPKRDASGNQMFTRTGNPAATTVSSPPPAIELELDPGSLNGARFKHQPNIWTLVGFVFALSAHRSWEKLLAAEQKRIDSLKKRGAICESLKGPDP